MFIRFYKPSDAEAVKELWKRQGVEAHLALPGEDPAAIIGVVGVEGERLVLAEFGKLTVEATVVIAPDEPAAAQKIKRVKDYAEGALLLLSERMRQLGFGAITDVEAYVPRNLGMMARVMYGLGFIDEPPEFRRFYKRLGV